MVSVQGIAKDFEDFEILLSAHSAHQGDDIEATEPAVFKFSTEQLVSAGRPRKISIDIYCDMDPRHRGPQQYRTEGEKGSYLLLDNQS